MRFNPGNNSSKAFSNKLELRFFEILYKFFESCKDSKKILMISVGMFYQVNRLDVTRNQKLN